MGEQKKKITVSILEYMKNRSFIIPAYQRNYDWTIDQCRQLYDDLLKINSENRRRHFFGILVLEYCSNAGSTIPKYRVIDGQQRLTTLTLLLLATRDLISEGEINPENPNLHEKIQKLIRSESGEDQIKLKSVKEDEKAFQKLFQNEENEHIQSSNLTVNYQYFRDRIRKGELAIDQLYRAAKKLEIINFELEQDDSPQQIFESLNSTGLNLTEGDKIRNYMLMNLKDERIEKSSVETWNRIEKYVSDVSMYIRDYLSVKRRKFSSLKRIYLDFKEYAGNLPKMELLEDMCSYARRYQTLLNGKSSCQELNDCIRRLNHLETTVTRPFFMEVLRLQDEKKLNLSQVKEIFDITESYLFRILICTHSTKTMNKIFLTLHKEIVSYDGTENEYLEKFKYALLCRKNCPFPEDREFLKNLTECEIYFMNTKNKLYILERFENNTKEKKEIYSYFGKSYSIEHILPQKLTLHWSRELGDDCEAVHQTWLHRLANLTLTAYNSSYSNRSFEEKKNMKNGFKESGFRLNQKIIEKDKWTAVELEERSHYLGQEALEIWKRPHTEFNPPRKTLRSGTLEDIEAFTNLAIKSFQYKNTEYAASSWRHMVQEVLQMLYEENPAPMIQIANSDSCKTLSAEPGNHRTKIRDSIYVNLKVDTLSKLKILQKVFKSYGIAPSDLVFFVGKKKHNPEMEKPRHKLRKAYWTAALEELRKLKDSPFNLHRVSGTIESFLDIHFKIQAAHLVCRVTKSHAQVDLYIDQKDKAKNKEVFDILLARRDEIESSLGISLIWDRSEERRASKIYHRLENVSLKNQADWPKMIQFHVEWCRKIYDVFVPILKKMNR